MIHSWRARLRRLRLALLSAGTIIVIVLGVLAGLTQLAMPWLAHHPQHVERWLSDRLDRPVTIGHLSGSWVGGGPLLALDDVHIGAGWVGQRALRIPRAELAFDLYALFKRNSAMTEFRVSGLDLRLVNEEGGWRLHGLDLEPAQQSSEPFSLGALGALEISQLKLRIEDPERALNLTLEVPVLRLLNRGATTRVLGRVRLAGTDAPLVDLVADLDPRTRSGELYFGGTQIDLGAFSAQPVPGGIRPVSGRGTVQVWAWLKGGVVDDIRTRVDLADAGFQADSAIETDKTTAVAPRIAFGRFAFAARWLRGADGWSVDLANFVAGDRAAAPATARIERHDIGADDYWRVAVAATPLEPLGSFAMLVNSVPAGLRRWLYLAHPRGNVTNGQLTWRSAADYDLEVGLRAVELASAGAVPGVERIDLDLRGDAGALLLHVPNQRLRGDYPHVFRYPFLFSDFGGDVVAQRIDDAWSLATDQLVFEGEGYGGELRGGLDLKSGQRPFADLYARVTHADVTATKLFLPTITMPPKAMEWLDHALVAGKVTSGRAVLRGDLGEWPFHALGGRMIARAEIADLKLDYAPDWPVADKVQAIATFINDGMQVDVSGASSMGNRVTIAHATIADFDASVLDLDAKGEGSGAHLLDFLRATPVGKRYQEHIKGLAVGGKGEVAFTLKLPLEQPGGVALDGHVDLSAAKLDHSQYDLHFTDASGKVAFNQNGLAAGPLDVGYRGSKAKLSLAVGGGVADPKHVFEAALAGRFPVTTVFADVPALLPMLSSVSGESVWKARVDIDASENGDGGKRFALDSDLVGTTIGLPPPLAKNAGATLPFHLEIPLPYAGKVFSARLGSVAGIKGRLPAQAQAFAARIDFGAGAVGELPSQGIAIGGRIPQLDLGGWVDQVSGGPGSGGLVRSVDIRVDDLVLAQRHFDNLQLTLDHAKDLSTIRFDGAALAGNVEIPASGVGRPISAKFARFHWPETPPNTPDAPALTGIAPGSIPALNIAIDDFRLGTASFGSALFESHPAAGAMRVDKLETHSPNVNMTASGDWSGTAKSNRSRMAIKLTAQNLGHMMAALGFPGLVDGGSTEASIDAAWPGPPSAFALPKLDGTLDIKVAEGRFPEVEPGAGRIFGLLSLTEIPRRLSLDFSDFFRSGLGFNSITGKFRLSDGDAYTDGLTIKSPAADIVVTGRTGLRSKDYDQQMNVTPHAGATLPIVGALAAGPVGAAAGLVMQGILSKPLGKAIARRYSVTGPWDKPKIVLEKQGSERPSGGAAQAENPVKPKGRVR